MKKGFVFSSNLSIAVRAAIALGLIFASCSNPSGSNEELSGTVSIAGDAAVGQTLSANTDSLGGTGSISYQWKRADAAAAAGTNIGGATGSTYTLADADMGKYITVTVTRSGNSGSVTSEATAAVARAGAPALEGTVAISGTAEVGQTLTANTDGLGGSGAVSYQWKRGTANVGANSSTYTVQAADVGYAITVTVTRIGYSGSVTSEASAAVTNPLLPALEGTVAISGDAEVGQTLAANTDGLGGSGAIFYQWKRGTANVGANSSAYTVQPADTGYAITVTVTRAGNSGSVSSLPTAAVVDNRPALTGAVSISGSAIAGETLTAITSSLGGSGAISYQWKRGTANGGTDIGTNSSGYTLTAADAGYAITVIVTRAGNSGSVASPPTEAVVLPALTGSVSISGNAVAGQTLTAITSSLGGTGDISYQWKRGTANGGTDIGTNSNAYTVQPADAGYAITVTVTRTGYSGSVSSQATAEVVLADLTGNVTISQDGTTGIFTTGAPMTAHYSGQEDVDFEWYKDGNSVATGDTYAPAETGDYTATASAAGYNSKTSAPVAVVPGENAVVAIFSGFGDETIDLAKSTDNDISQSRRPDYLTVTLNGQYDEYRWFVDGSEWGYDRGVTLYAGYFPIGIHTVAAVVVKDGVPYSKELTFRVVR